MFDERMASSMITHRFAAKALGAASMSARSLEASAAGKCLVQSAQACVPLWLVLLCITLHLLSGTANADAEAATAGAKQQDTHTVLTSEAESLAQPKSLQQTGIPADATRAAIPSDNPQTPGKIALGQRLFFERRLSADGTVACSNCHDPKQAFTDGRPVSIGIKGHVGQRNAPTILNALYNKTQFWDGRVRTLEEQAAQPIVNPSEMGQPNLDAAIASIAVHRRIRSCLS